MTVKSPAPLFLLFSWPLLWDPEKLGLDIIRSLSPDKLLILNAGDSHILDYDQIIRAMEDGATLVLDNVVTFDSSLEPILAKKFNETGLI